MAASIDLKDDDISRKQNLKIKMPTLVLWGKKVDRQWYDPLSICKNIVIKLEVMVLIQAII